MSSPPPMAPQALKKARSASPSLIVLDLMLPEIDGLEVCKMLRRDPATAAHSHHHAHGQSGGDGPHRRPGAGRGGLHHQTLQPARAGFAREEGLAARRAAPAEPEPLKFGDLLIDAPRHLVKWRGKQVELTATEFKLLAILAQRRGRVQSRDQLLHDVWEYNSLVDTRTVDTHMRRLREKLGPAAKHLDTVRGVGYRFVEAAS